MRPLAILATVLTCAAANAAAAQTLASRQTLTLPPTDSAAQADDVGALAILNSAAFAPRGPADDADPIDRLMTRETFQPGQGPVRWTSGQAQLSGGAGGPVDSLRVSVGGVLRTPGGAPLNLRGAQFEAQAYEVALTRDWPAAVAFGAGRFGVDLTPHAGLGVTSYGGSAEAGATVRLMQRDAAAAERLKALGLRDGGSEFGGQGRWYLFAAASGRAVGMNMLHGEQGWDRAGWTTDPASTLTGDAQVGVGWRKGAMQTSFGYIHREMKGQNALFGVEGKKDSMVAFTLSIQPH